MSLRLAKSVEEETADAFAAMSLLNVRRTVPGFEGTQLITAFSGMTYVNVPLDLSGHGASCTLTTAGGGISVGCMVLSGVNSYASELANEILTAAAAAPEAEFDNVVDMLEWLNRD